MRFSSSDAAGRRGIPGLGPGVSPTSVTGLLKEMAGSSEFAFEAEARENSAASKLGCKIFSKGRKSQ
jgi:hypothetical protein